MSIPPLIVIDGENYILNKYSNDGSTSKCGIYVLQPTNTPFFIKFFIKKGVYKHEIDQEIAFLEKIKTIKNSKDYFPQIISHGFIKYESFQYFIIFNVCEGEELLSCDIKNSEEDIFRKLCEAVSLLHENDIIHCDIKLENIIYDKKTKNIKLVDFGGSKMDGEYILNNILCTTEYISPPEYMKYLKEKTQPFYIDKSFDLWSLGICYFKLYNNKNPTPFGELVKENFLSDCKNRKMIFF